MIPQEAIKELKRMQLKTDDIKLNAAIYVAVSALEKQTPKKPIFQPRVYFGFDGHTCPTCGQYIKSKNDPILPKFCRDCGQALDWT